MGSSNVLAVTLVVGYLTDARQLTSGRARCRGTGAATVGMARFGTSTRVLNQELLSTGLHTASVTCGEGGGAARRYRAPHARLPPASARCSHRARRAVIRERQARALGNRSRLRGRARWRRSDRARPTPRCSCHQSAARTEPHARSARGKGLQTAPVRKTGTQQTLYLFAHRSAPFFRGRAVVRQITITRHVAALRTITRDHRDDQPDPIRCQTMVEIRSATERGCRNGARWSTYTGARRLVASTYKGTEARHSPESSAPAVSPQRPGQPTR